MKTSYALPLIAAILMALPLRAAPIVPGTGIQIESLSDDFEDPDWSFDYATNISSNKLWRGSYRGAPTSLEVLPTPSGGPSGSTQTLQVRTDDTVTEPNQADLVSASYLTRIGRRLTRADLPNFVMHAYLSASSEWPEGKYTFQMRLETDTQAGLTYPSLSFYRFGNTAYLDARTWDPSTWSTTLGNNLPARWVTIGHSFDIDGWHSMYYRTGVGPLTAADHLHTQTKYAGTQTDWLGYHFVSLQKNEGGPLTPDHRMDNYFVYAAGWAHTPSPADGSLDTMPDATLGWTAGQSATAHAVYFGTSPTLGAGDFQGSQSGTTFDPGGLALNTTYYWRIDETNPAGVATGLVWRFSTPTVYAQTPQPEDEAVDVALDAGLSWTAHPLATAQAVYLGRESDLGPDDFQGEQTGTTFGPGSLEWGTTYYWRVDSITDYGTATGAVWHFTTLTPPLATHSLPFAESFETIPVGHRPSPADGWTIMGGGTAVVGDDAAALFALTNGYAGTLPLDTTHTRMLRISDATAEVAVDGTGVPLVETDFMVLPLRNSHAPVLNAESQLGIYLDADGHLVVRHAETSDGIQFVNTSRVLTNSPAVPEGSWMRVTLLKDYAVGMFQVRLNGGDPLTDAQGWTHGGGARPGSWFYLLNRASIQLNHIAVFSPEDAWIDDLRIAAGALPSPAPAAGPDISDGADDVMLAATLGWAPAEYASAYAVYFGTTPELGAGDFLGETLDASFNLGVLAPGTTYYWRIDAVGSGGTTQGTVWSFQTLPDTPPRFVALSIVDGLVQIFYTGNEVGAEIPYVMLRSTNLASGAWSVVDPQVPRTANPETSLLWEDPTPPEGAGFYKLSTTP